ncbi:MAG: hypothetical protein HZA89_10175 [Verrucomicrobia bacterium]|nr:hypothetical protein [Verrucomicrobiota bacterium]
MASPGLILCLLLTGGFTLAGWLVPWQQQSGARRGAGGFLAALMGDSRRLFANHFFVKADVYFHSGYYPSIFDNQAMHQTPHMAADAGVSEDKNAPEEGSFLGPPLDWMDRFSRNFFPALHTHLDEGGADDHKKHAHKPGEPCELSAGLEKEILPWLRISAELDPHRVETYTVSAFWLRTKLRKVDAAEQFLREGLRANPGSYEILHELARLYLDSRRDPARARNLWELAFRRWRERAPTLKEPDNFALMQITASLMRLEERAENYAKAIAYGEILKTVSPHPDLVQKDIDLFRQKLGAPPK